MKYAAVLLGILFCSLVASANSELFPKEHTDCVNAKNHLRDSRFYTGEDGRCGWLDETDVITDRNACNDLVCSANQPFTNVFQGLIFPEWKGCGCFGTTGEVSATTF